MADKPTKPEAPAVSTPAVDVSPEPASVDQGTAAGAIAQQVNNVTQEASPTHAIANATVAGGRFKIGGVFLTADGKPTE